MKKNLSFVLSALLFIVSSCKVEELVSEFGTAVITAKEKVGEVINKAKSDFAADAQLTAIYGWNVDTQGEIDLQKPTERAFVYVVQSDSLAQNEFYVPVYKASPVRSPINFNDMLSFIRDDNAKGIMGSIFGKLSTLHITAGTPYSDSPDVLSSMFSLNEVATFRSTHPKTKIDMFLVPSKSIADSLSNSADWIVNFYADTTSLVMWLHTDTGEIKNLNEL
jgi:hypothetical protein